MDFKIDTKTISPLSGDRKGILTDSISMTTEADAGLEKYLSWELWGLATLKQTSFHSCCGFRAWHMNTLFILFYKDNGGHAINLAELESR